MYRILKAPHEVLVGCPLDIEVEMSSDDKNPLSVTDWIGIYPSTIPTLPGLSHGRWRYINGNIDQIENSHSSQNNKIFISKPEVVTIRFEPHELPIHSGHFDIRIHHNNEYGNPCASLSFYMVDYPISFWRRALLVIFFVVSIASFQHILNEKGQCTFLDPEIYVNDVIDDAFIRATIPLNKWFIQNMDSAAACQAISSLILDASTITLIYLGSTRRSSIRPFLAIFLFMLFRFVAQLMAVMPCPPGFLWPVGKLFGFEIPTIFVDYKPTNDMFFSGHTGSTLVIALELIELDYEKIGLFQLFVVLPFISVWVVSARVHRGIDVIAGLLAAISACSVSKRLSEPIDRLLRVTHNQFIFNNSTSHHVKILEATQGSPRKTQMEKRKKKVT
jgi:hypothetical protein